MQTIKFNIENPAEVLEDIRTKISNLNYSSSECSRYTMLMEEALINWKSCSNLSKEANYEVSDSLKKIKMVLSVKGPKCYCFSSSEDDSDWISRMHDRLLSGTGVEIKCKYWNGTNYITLTLPKHDHEHSLFKMNVIALAIPVAIQYLLTRVISATDSILMGILDQNSLSAISITATFALLYTILQSALISGATIFASQFWGERDWKGINRVFSVSLSYSFICSVIFFIPSLLFPKIIMRFYTNIPDLIDLGSKYLRIVSGMFVFNSFSQIYGGILRNTGKVLRSTIFMVTASVINFVLDIILIFGFCGFKRMGIEGAALATLISSAVYFLMSFVDCLRNRNLHFSVKLSFDKESKKLIHEYLKKSYPLVVQMTTWTIADNICTSIFGHLNSDIVAANGIITIVEDLGIFALVGLYETCGILIGRKLGKNQLDDARIYGRRYLKYAGIVGMFTMAGVFIISLIIDYLPLSLTPMALKYLHVLLIVAAFEIFFIGINNIMNHGGFYAGGDTMALMVIDTLNMWLIIIPIGLLCFKVFHFPPLIIAVFLHMDELTSFPFKYARYKKYKWLKKIT